MPKSWSKDELHQATWALYNTMMKDVEIFKAIAKAVSKYDKSMKLMILSTAQNEKFSSLASKYDVSLLYEVFADRAYQDDGSLVPRSQDGAVLHTVDEVLKRAELLQLEGVIESINGKKLALHADTLCVHGDNTHALELLKALNQL